MRKAGAAPPDCQHPARPTRTQRWLPDEGAGRPIACDGRGLCAKILSELITLDDWGFPIIRDGAREAALVNRLSPGIQDAELVPGIAPVQPDEHPLGISRGNL